MGLVIGTINLLYAVASIDGRHRPAYGRLRDGMGDILGYARVSTGDQDVAGQTMRLTKAGAIKLFTDVRSGRTMERPGLAALLAYAREEDRSRSCVSTGSDAHSANC